MTLVQDTTRQTIRSAHLAHSPAAGWLDANRGRLFDGMFALMRIPSVGTDPAYAAGMEQASAFLVDHLARIGLHDVQRLDAGGHRAVYAEWLGAPGAPTLLLYAHYDVQPPDPLELWREPPFEPAVRDGRIYCRGASDDKGPLWTMLCALEAVLATEGAFPVNLKLLIEGEEEIGSRTLPGILRRHRDRLMADAVISADGAHWRHDLLSVNTNCRGFCALEFTVRTADGDLHSGRYGGVVANAASVLCRMVASMHDETGRVAVEGFHDGLRPASTVDRASMDAIDFDGTAFLAQVGAKPGAAERGVPMLEAMWLRPTLEVNGISGGYAGAGTKTVLPSSASAKITCRLGVGQEPHAVADAIARHLQAHCPATATLTVDQDPGGARAYFVPEDNPALLAVERMMEALHGRKPLHVGSGGTLPIACMVKEILGLETIMVSNAVSDSDAHAPNEFFRISSFDDGLRAWLLLLPELAKVSRP